MNLLLAILLVLSASPDFVVGLEQPTTNAVRGRPTAFPHSIAVQDTDRDTVVRQTGQVAPSKAAIGIPQSTQCRHGFPQAFAMDPLPMHSGRINSGLLKLTCPHLVRAVDDLEDDGAIETFNQQLRPEWCDEILEAHRLHASVRRTLLTSSNSNDRIDSLLESKLGPRGAAAFLEAGVAGASISDDNSNLPLDVKCLHAWLADALFRGTESSWGGTVVQTLQERGVHITGTPTCHMVCSSSSCPSHNKDRAPPVPRNKQRLKTGKERARRQRRKQRDQ